MEPEKQSKKKANIPIPGPGRKKGVPNKATQSIREMIEKSLGQVGGVDYLAEQAIKNPGPYLALVGKVLPLQITGEGGGPVVITIDPARMLKI